MTQRLAKTADRIVRRWTKACTQPDMLTGLDWESIRDAVDIKTGGELDCIQLDILTDMVKGRLS